MAPAAEGRQLTVDMLRRLIARRIDEGWSRLEPDPDRDARRDARLIVAHALGVEPGRLTLIGDGAVTAEIAAATEALAVRRGAGEPVARLLGSKEFWSLPFNLSAATLVPRPDTETVIVAALEILAARRATDQPLRIVDIGTGSGAILLALLSELPAAFGIGIDRAEAAAQTARENAGRLGLAGRSAFVCGNWGEMICGPVDVIVTNPPYIPSDTVASLPAEVRLFDPSLALDGGSDGLAAYRSIIADLHRLLGPNGFAVLEVGKGQAESVVGLGKQHGFSGRTRDDLADIERVVVLSRQET